MGCGNSAIKKPDIIGKDIKSIDGAKLKELDSI